jgi:hypothetical protein
MNKLPLLLGIISTVFITWHMGTLIVLLIRGWQWIMGKGE